MYIRKREYKYIHTCVYVCTCVQYRPVFKQRTTRSVLRLAVCFVSRGEERRTIRRGDLLFFAKSSYVAKGKSYVCNLRKSATLRVLDSTLAINQIHPVPRAPSPAQPTDEARLVLSPKDKPSAPGWRAIMEERNSRLIDHPIAGNESRGSRGSLFATNFRKNDERARNVVGILIFVGRQGTGD